MNPLALAALKSYQQADADGVMVLVSRQALDEAITTLENLYALGLLVEEMGEASQMIGKALRFGLDTSGPPREPYLGRTARQLLPIELGDVGAAIDWAGRDGVVDADAAALQHGLKLDKLLSPASQGNLGQRLAPEPRGTK